MFALQGMLMTQIFGGFDRSMVTTVDNVVDDEPCHPRPMQGSIWFLMLRFYKNGQNMRKSQNTLKTLMEHLKKQFEF